MERKELIQKVIDRSIHYGEDFERQLLLLMERYPLVEEIRNGHHFVKKPDKVPERSNKPTSIPQQWQIPSRRKRYNL